MCCMRVLKLANFLIWHEILKIIIKKKKKPEVKSRYPFLRKKGFLVKKNLKKIHHQKKKKQNKTKQNKKQKT